MSQLNKKTKKAGCVLHFSMGLTQSCPKEKTTGYLGYADYIGHDRTTYIYIYTLFSYIWGFHNKR